jgi:peptidoglycan/LPS O-acetylase OafA/YrhL
MYYYVVAFFTQRVPSLVVAIVLMALAAITPEDTYYGERLFFLGSLFFLGGWCSYRLAEFEALVHQSWLAVLLLPTCVLTWDSAVSGPHRYHAGNSLFVLMGILCILHVCTRLARVPWFYPVRYIGEHSLVFYALHIPLMAFIGNLAVALYGSYSPAMRIVALVLSFVLGFALAIGRERSGYVQALFTAPDFLRQAPALKSKLAAFVNHWLRWPCDGPATETNTLLGQANWRGSNR